MQRKPKNKAQPRPPTLHVDTRQAWRQSEDAVILPIIYDSSMSARTTGAPDSILIPILPITWPHLPLESAVSQPPFIETLSSEEDRKMKLAVLKQRAELAKTRITRNSTRHTNGVPPVVPAPEITFVEKARHLSTAVPLLLLGVVALVLFAWATFR